MVKRSCTRSSRETVPPSRETFSRSDLGKSGCEHRMQHSSSASAWRRTAEWLSGLALDQAGKPSRQAGKPSAVRISEKVGANIECNIHLLLLLGAERLNG